MLEVNGKTIRNASSFFEQIYPLWVEHSAFLFIDEGHNLPKDLQQIFLSVLNVDKDPVRTVNHDGESYTFDFNKLTFCMATTGNPRDAVVKADDLKTYVVARDVKKITKKVWSDFCDSMGVKKFGLTASEISIVKALGERGAMSLTGLASVTGFQRGAIQRDYETMLVKKRLIKIDVKRELTQKGFDLARQIA